jgi:sulfate transport system ATP-binding protein
VNLFHARVQGGRAYVGQVALELPEQVGAMPVVGYARPHEIELHRADPSDANEVLATVARIQAVGPIVRVELKQNGREESLDAELSKERYGELRLSVGEQVFVRPRNLRLFPEPAREPGATR